MRPEGGRRRASWPTGSVNLGPREFPPPAGTSPPPPRRRAATCAAGGADSRTAELLDGVCDVDLDALDVELPRGFGRD